MSDPDRAALLFPVGQPLGELHARPGGGPSCHRLRIGRRPVHLTDPAEALLWQLAHGGVPGGAPCTAGAVLDRAAALGVAGAADVLRTMLRSGTLAAVRLEPAEAAAFARRLRMCPMLLGFGPLPSGGVAVGLAGGVLAELPAPIHELWRWAGIAGSIWEVCAALGLALPAGAARPPTESLVLALLGDLHPMLTAGAVYLDAALTMETHTTTNTQQSLLS
ncbi:hypothetical protein KZZ52_27930 [Dactylosporangium sp. AC04546]|uniref:hypothetical protein n=1 Tax=Dactylosporangium sp. AC04546 TaxID=2862460 RepID=UPI001EDFD3BD|nr:hypothetical protein [Dactylosporangium sp. AC04546]WVK89097.1 hypothetical protein KZZ52_27930 [Dactylosporangium sp. AC04546]